MSTELFWLVLTVAMTGLFWVPYIPDRIMARGLMGAMANPSPSDKAQSPWARRMMAAHTNAVENLVIFAPLVLTARALSIATVSTSQNSSVDMAFPPWLEPANADWLAQRTADLDGGHDAIVKNDATIVIAIAAR